MRESRIFTNSELKEIKERLAGNRKDKTGIFARRVKPKIIEILDIWINKKNILIRLIAKKKNE